MASSMEECAAPPLTLENLMSLIPTHSRWWDEVTRLAGMSMVARYGLLSILGIPQSQQEAFREQCSSEDKAVSKCIEWWLQQSNVSWREVIYKLDKGGEMKLADGMRKYAEPLEDHSLNIGNVTKVIEVVTGWMMVGQFGLLLPNVVLDKIARECASDHERKSALATYIVTTLPDITWETIAAKLYYSNETRAVEQAKKYVSRVADPTLTAARIIEVLKEVRYMHFSRILDVPYDKLLELQFQGKEAVVSYALQTHPCLSWKRLSKTLQMHGYSEAAAEVTRKYVKGGASLFLSCVNHVVKNYEFYQPLLPLYLPSHIQTYIHQEWEETKRSLVY